MHYEAGIASVEGTSGLNPGFQLDKVSSLLMNSSIGTEFLSVLLLWLLFCQYNSEQEGK